MAFNKSKVMDAARKYVEKGQTDKAIREYLRVVREDPKDVRVWLKIGDLYAKRGAKQEATDTYLKVAKFYSEQGFYLKAVAVYKQILKLDPRLVEVNLKLAELYRQLGLLSDAMQHFEMVAAHFHREGKTAEALATVRQLVDLDPENIATRIKLAELYSKEGMAKEAVVEFGHACDYLRRQNRQDDFIKVAERLLWHDPSNTKLNRELANLYLRRNDPRRALQKLQICFKANSRDVETLALLAQAFQALDQKAKTVSVLKELARILDENGQRGQAEEVHRKIVMYVPDDPDSLAYLGEQAGAVVPEPEPEPAPPPQRSSRVNITSSDLPAKRTANPTGSMPLVEGAEELSADFDVEEEEDDDFAADFDLEASSAEGSFAAEVHSDEINKILTETDVYVKYGLAQKAIDHLRRVFDLDPRNIEAHERLKDILIAQGREDEAIDELMHLADATATTDPDRAENYLRELLQLDGTYRPAFELARRFRLDVTGAPEVEIVDDLSDDIVLDADALGTGQVEPVEEELDFDDIDFGDSSPGQEVPRGEPVAGYGDFELDLESSDGYIEVPAKDPQSITMEVDVDQVEGMVALDEAELDLEFGEPADPPMPTPAPPTGGPEAGFADAAAFDAQPVAEIGFDELEPGAPEPVFDPAAAAAFDADIEGSVPAEPVPDGVPEPLFDPHEAAAFDAGLEPPPFDPDAAAEFDADPVLHRRPDPHSLAAEPMEFEADFATSSPHPAPPRTRRPSTGGEDFVDDGATEFQPDLVAEILATPDSGAVPPTAEGLPAQPFATDAPTTDTPFDTIDGDYEVVGGGGAPAGATSIEDDLDEADFFVTQGLYDEARDILTALLDRHPGHPLVTAKLRDVDAMAAQTGGAAEETPIPELDPDAIEEIHDVSAFQGETLDATTDDPAKPTVLLEKPVDEEDADTHYDLGLAYKEMGLYDEAIKAFEKVAHSSGGREVQCRLMIGLCHREQGNVSEAIHQFKTGLHAETITDAEKLSLYYEIGTAYESDDPKEALYYFEMVRKKDPSYRDVGGRISAIESAGASNGVDTRRTNAAPEDADAAIDALLAEADNGSGRR